jgi:hypothetical protein
MTHHAPTGTIAAVEEAMIALVRAVDALASGYSTPYVMRESVAEFAYTLNETITEDIDFQVGHLCAEIADGINEDGDQILEGVQHDLWDALTRARVEVFGIAGGDRPPTLRRAMPFGHPAVAAAIAADEVRNQRREAA